MGLLESMLVRVRLVVSNVIESRGKRFAAKKGTPFDVALFLWKVRAVEMKKEKRVGVFSAKQALQYSPLFGAMDRSRFFGPEAREEGRLKVIRLRHFYEKT